MSENQGKNLRAKFGGGADDAAMVRIDAATSSLQTVDYAHHEIHSGSHFTVTYGVADIGAATSPNDAVTLTFSTPNTAKWAHMVVLFNGVGGTLCRIREGGSGGASPTGALTCWNNNRNSDNTSGLLDIGAVGGQMSYDAGLDTGGNLIVDEFIAGATTNQNKAGGGASGGERFEWVLKQNTRYQISMLSTASVAGAIVLHWYEHTNHN